MDDRVVVLGNSGSGKSTLARRLAGDAGVVLDLDTVAWRAGEPGVRQGEATSIAAIDAFIAGAAGGWVVEGCYAGLIAHASTAADVLVWLNPGVDACVANCNARPWEPHKYATKAEQDATLAMLVEWVRRYATREDEFGEAAHRRVFEGFGGRVVELASNAGAARFALG